MLWLKFDIDFIEINIGGKAVCYLVYLICLHQLLPSFHAITIIGHFAPRVEYLSYNLNMILYLTNNYKKTFTSQLYNLQGVVKICNIHKNKLSQLFFKIKSVLVSSSDLSIMQGK